MRISILISIYTVYFAFLKMYTKFENTGSNRSWVICDRNFPLERKKNEQIKGLISNMWLFFCYTIQLITIKLCTKFQNPNPSSCWEILPKKKFTDKQTDRQTNIITEKAKTIYPLYTSYRGYNKGLKDKWYLNEGQKYCRMLQESILQYFWPALSDNRSWKPFISLLFEWLKTGLTVWLSPN